MSDKFRKGNKYNNIQEIKNTPQLNLNIEKIPNTPQLNTFEKNNNDIFSFNKELETIIQRLDRLDTTHKDQLNIFEKNNNDISVLNTVLETLIQRLDRLETTHTNQLNTFEKNNNDISKVNKELETIIQRLDRFESNQLYFKQYTKISIVMAYYNRKSQTLETLKGFEKMYATKYNFEVIIVDDNSNDENRLDEAIKQFTFPINLIVINKDEKGDRINPVTAYNRGFSKATGKFIIIQNPEIFHCGNILEYAIENSEKIYNNYITFPVFSSPSYEHNNMLYQIHDNYYDNYVKLINYQNYDFNYEYYIKSYPDLDHMNKEEAIEEYLQHGIKNGRKCNEHNIFFRKNVIYDWKGWYNHSKYNPRNLHFLSIISRENIDKVGGFCEDFAYGLWYDDDDFLHRIKQVTNIITLESNQYFGVHQYHGCGSDEQHLDDRFSQLTKQNKDIFDYNTKNKIIYCTPYKIGLCFKVYVNEYTSFKRYEIIEQFLKSLYKISEQNNNLVIVGVVDCIPTDNLINILEKNKLKKMNIIYLNKNYGISYSTNRGIIELMNKGCDYIFCADDDIIFKQNSIFEKYIRTSIQFGIHHLSYYPSKLFKCDISNVNDKIREVIGYSGCFYMVRKCDILNKGLLPILNAKYGYEHEIFTKVFTQRQYDLINSDDLLELNKNSLKNCSGCKLDSNNINTLPNDYNLVPYEDMKLLMSKL